MSDENKSMQQLRGTAAALAARNIVPLAGQIVLETDTGMMKAGDGTTAYNSLPYVNLGSDVLSALAAAKGTGIHNCICRWKDLGGTFTQAQKDAIGDGSFNDLYVGDSWTFKNVPYTWTDDDGNEHEATVGVTFRIASFNYYYGCGVRESGIYTPHIVVIPSNALFTRAMNATATTAGGYANCDLRTKPSGLARAKAIFEACFGAGTLLSHQVFLQNEVTDGIPSNGAWMDSDGVELMTEAMAYGSSFFNAWTVKTGGSSSSGLTTGGRRTLDCRQLNLFQFRPNYSSNRQSCWLQDVVSDKVFSAVSNYGHCSCAVANTTNGVRPVFVLRKPAALGGMLGAPSPVNPEEEPMEE